MRINISKEKLVSVLAVVATLFSLGVIGLGALTRLLDAGLGCPDWPGCYGHLIPNQNADSHIVMYKAWAEMIHRYFVAGLSLFILSIITLIFWRPKKNILLACCLLALLIYQILLGQWTVTLKLLPIIVTQHLIGGFLILATLWLIYLNNNNDKPWQFSSLLMGALLAVLLLSIQIFLGAWTSTNYASLSCPDFPFCMTQHTFSLQIHDAFNLLSPLGVNYEGGVLPESVRQTIHMVHRMGALIVSCYLILFVIIGMKQIRQSIVLLQQMYLILGLLVFQITLGIANVFFQLPVLSSVMHTLTAALLLLALLSFIFKLRAEASHVV